MRGTFTLPDGHKYRAGSERRYVIVRITARRVVTLYRTNDYDRAMAGLAKHAGEMPERAVIAIDTVTGDFYQHGARGVAVTEGGR